VVITCCHFPILDNDESCPVADRSNRPVQWSSLLDLSAIEHAPDNQYFVFDNCVIFVSVTEAGSSTVFP